MTTDTLNFPVFHSEQGIKSDEVHFFIDGSIKDLDKASDLQLAKSAAHDDMGAFEEIYKRHHRRVYSVCLRMLQNTSEAEDLTQDVFIQLYRKIGSFRGDSAFTTWLLSSETRPQPISLTKFLILLRSSLTTPKTVPNGE